MRKTIVLVVLALITAGAAAQQATSDEQQIRAMLDEFMAAAGRGDRAVFDRFFADDLMYTRSAGATTTKPEIMKSLPEKPVAAGQEASRYRAEDVTVRMYGDTALVQFRLVQQTREGAHMKDTARFLNSAAFLKRNNRWQATLWQATKIPEEPPAEAKPEASEQKK
jgi:ketosteroid isomerase-like protein